jgi:hypothetical protein
VPPPTADDDRPKFRRYGVRVPSFIISPWVEANTVSHIVFDHTSLIKTILLKFCRSADGRIPDMGARVTHANHLGAVLTRSTPRPAPPVSQLQPLVAQLAAWHGEALTANLVRQARGEVWRPKPNDLQLDMKLARQQLRAKGLHRRSALKRGSDCSRYQKLYLGSQDASGLGFVCTFRSRPPA